MFEINQCETIIHIGNTEFRNLEFFFNTIEDLIDREENNEIQLFKSAHANFQSEHIQDLFPFHWDQLFRGKFRSIFIIALTSTLEFNLKLLCNSLLIISPVPMKPDDLKGSLLERSKKFLESFYKFNFQDNECWQSMQDIFEIRNIIVHNGGFIPDNHKGIRIRNFCKKNPAFFDSDSELLEIKKEFCSFAFQIILAFYQEIVSEAKIFCDLKEKFAG